MRTKNVLKTHLMSLFGRHMQSQNGNVLMIAMATLATATAVGYSLMNYSQSRSEDFGVWMQKKQTLYMSEGLQNIAKETLKQYLANNPSATSPEILESMNKTLPDVAADAGFKFNEIKITQLTDLPASPLPDGAFAGILAPQRLVNFDISIGTNSNLLKADINSKTAISMNIFQISMFQFMAFSDLNYIDYHPGPKMNLIGRVHVNGDICLSGDTGIYIQYLTTSGRTWLHGNSNCRFPNNDYSNRNVYISTDGIGATTANYKVMTSTGQSDCTNCDSKGLDWKDYAKARWNGYMKDRSLEVSKVELPYSRYAPAQFAYVEGTNADNANATASTNAGKLRFLLDPVVVNENADSRKSKFSYLADVRIIDGVWFIKDPANPDSWPGLPIWSDHPGRANQNITGGYQMKNIGQQDISDFWDTKSLSWDRASGKPVPPKFFSYYEYDQEKDRVSDDLTGVVSYGSLLKRSSTGLLRPGFMLTAGNSTLCGGKNLSNGLGGSGMTIDDDQAKCGSGAPKATLPASTRILLSARAGFRNPHTYLLSEGNLAARQSKSLVLPLNFDVNAFQTALKATGKGELGTYFGSNGFMKRDFNGIVYISNSWPGSLDGLTYQNTSSGAPKGAPKAAPYQGGTSATNAAVFNGTQSLGYTQAPTINTNQQGALPYQLCTSNPSTNTTGPRVGTGLEELGSFKIPSCADYENGFLAAYPNAVRVIRGGTLDKTVLKKGLSIVTNLGMYVTGDFNSGSDGTDASSTNWTSALLGGDQLTVLSNAWDDTSAPWTTTFSNFTGRTATDTKIVSALITGWTRHIDRNNGGYSVAANTFPINIEDWGGKNLNFFGSMVFGFYPVYQRHGTATSRGGIESYGPPNRNFTYDPHLAFMPNQPPGTPLFPIAGILNYQRDNSISLQESIATKNAGQ